VCGSGVLEGGGGGGRGVCRYLCIFVYTIVYMSMCACARSRKFGSECVRV